MAESVLLSMVSKVASRAADALVQRVTLMFGIDEDRHKLERRLLAVQSLLAHAEVKSESSPAIRKWMKDLKAVAYRAEDVLDDFQYEALRREAESHQSMASKVLSKLTSKNRLVFRHKASRDLKDILGKIEELVAEMNTFGLVERAEAPRVLHRQTHSALDVDNEIYGRDHDKEVLVKLLLDQQDKQRPQVLPIVGMGGLGKTTLAKMVYNDCRVQKHFGLKIWHWVSETFDVCPLIRSIIELATNARCNLPDTIELLRGRLQEAIGQKRYLLVLDDVWNEEQQKWEDNLKPLLYSCGGSGSMIVVTSRSRQVALIMGTLPSHDLACLSEDDSWELFSKKAFSKGVQEQEEFVMIGRRIVKRCKGLPLALKTMGGLMGSKQNVLEWEAILHNNMADIVGGKDEVLSILKLSYRHLSSEMKQCFAFCAVFPKGYEMEKDMLIQLWMANGYIQGEGTMDFEHKGGIIFNDLVWRSFLQDVKLVGETHEHKGHDSFRESIGCQMHDLMHDLAKDVTTECVTVEELIQQNASIEDARHLQICSLDKMNHDIGLFEDKISLRTLLMIRTPDYWSCKVLLDSLYKLEEMFLSTGRSPNLTERMRNVAQDLMKLEDVAYGSPEALKVLCQNMPLRVLSCYNPSVIHNQLLRSAHLRYLDLSWADIVRLPNSICTLYNLQSLKLNNCRKLQYLPKGMINLKQLRHIYLLGCSNLERMPPNLSQLSNLRTLTKFIVASEPGCGIEELKDLQLGSRLELYNLGKVNSGSKANLHEKKNLSELLLSWGVNKCNIITSDSAAGNEEVLESLVPHGELKMLEVHQYGGFTISQWMKDPQKFECLRELIISHCPKCTDVPVVWLSSSLEHLHLSNMDSVTILCKNIGVEAAQHGRSPHVFPMLQRMTLDGLPNLERWAESSAGEPHRPVTFPQLKELKVAGCRKLANLPEAPVLTHLAANAHPFNYSAEGFVPLSMSLGSWPSLVRLHVGLQVNVSMSFEQQQDQSKTSTETLRCLHMYDDAFVSMFNLPKLQLGLGDGLTFVEELDLLYCQNIVQWPVEELRYLPRLRYLRIFFCNKLEGKCSSSEEILSLPQLERLIISYCHSLLEIPKLPTSLEELHIGHCESLAVLPSNLGDLAKLRYLNLTDCNELKVLPHGMDGLTSLERLRIINCSGIDKFPQGLIQRLPSLKCIRISDCPDLERHCREGGEYFDLVTQIDQDTTISDLFFLKSK